MDNYAPIVLTVYNRPELTKKVIDSLRRNTIAGRTHLYIYSDRWKNVDSVTKVNEVRKYIRNISGFLACTVVERSRNLGLAENAIDAITEVLKIHRRVIYLEDDNLVSPFFLDYINQGLELYKDDLSVASINGYIPRLDWKGHGGSEPVADTFFLKGADTWGWGTWDRAWEVFDPSSVNLLAELKKSKELYRYNICNSCNYFGMLKANAMGLNNSHTIRWYTSTFLKGMYTLYPRRSLVKNIGTAGGGTHFTSPTDIYDTDLSRGPIKVLRIPIADNKDALSALALFNIEGKIGSSIYRMYFSRYVPILLHRLLRKFIQCIFPNRKS
jgi:hypothetical protein